MTIHQRKENDTLTFTLEGRLDTTTAPELEGAIKESLDGVKEFIMDFKDLVYVSSAGLRVILATQKKMGKQGKMIIKNVNEMVMEVFEVTGFVDILTIE